MHYPEGVHFHERLLHEQSRTLASATMKEKKKGDTGVYFEGEELRTSCCMHPLVEDPKIKSRHPATVHIMAAVPCAIGQPLFAPPVLPTKIVSQSVEMMEIDSTSASTDVSPGRRSVHKHPSHHKHDDHSIRLKDCARSCHHLFCETKRTAVRARLSSRDYRLSSDELTFVEAAVQLSKGLSPPQMPTRGNGIGEHSLFSVLTKPSLPFLGGRFD